MNICDEYSSVYDKLKRHTLLFFEGLIPLEAFIKAWKGTHFCFVRWIPLEAIIKAWVKEVWDPHGISEGH